MITITEKAAAQVRSIMVEENALDHHLRIGVVGGGCSGLEYYMGLDQEITADDEVFTHDGFKVVVDRASLPYLEGAKLDFSNDFMNSGFIFDNPNATRTCGCGKSFCG